MAYIEYSDENSPASNAVGSGDTPPQTSAPEQITPQTGEPMPDYIYQHNQAQTNVGAQPSVTPDYIYQPNQNVFAPTPVDITAQNLYAAQENLRAQPPTPINYTQNYPEFAPSGITSVVPDYRPGIDPQITYEFERPPPYTGYRESPTETAPNIPVPLTPAQTAAEQRRIRTLQGVTGPLRDARAKGTQGQTLGDTVFMRGGGMPRQAQELAARGRHGDTALAHVNPLELEGIARLFPERTITRNPDTGLPEMFDFMSLLPTIAGIGASFFLGPIGAAAVSGLTTAITTKDIGKGVMAGLMSYGLGSLMGAGTESAAQAATAAGGDVAAGAVTPAVASPMLAETAAAGSGGAYPAFAPGQMGAYGQAVQRGGVILPSPSAAPGVFPPSAMQNWQASGMLPDFPKQAQFFRTTPTSSDPWQNLFGEAISDRDDLALEPANWNALVRIDDVPSAVPRAQGEVFPNDARLQQLQTDNFGAVDSGPERVLPLSSPPPPLSSPPPKADGILGGIGEDISNTAEMLTDRTKWSWEDTINPLTDNAFVDKPAFLAAGYRELGDLAIPLGAAGMGAYGTIAPLLEEEYELPERQKRTYAPARQIDASEYRVPSSPPVGYDPATEGEYSYYGNKGGIVSNLPTIHATGGYNQNQYGGAASIKILERAIEGSKNRQAPTGGQQLKGRTPQPMGQSQQPQGMTPQPMGQSQQLQVPRTSARDLAGLMRSYMPSANAQEGTAGKTVKEVAEEEIPMGAEEVATIGIMEGAPEVIQEGVRDEAMLTEPSDPQNAEERAIYDRAVLALEGELEPSDAQNAIDEYIGVFGAQAYRALKEMVGQARETGGMVRPANGETTVPDGGLQGEDVIAGKIVDPMTGAETANLRVGENEYIKTGKDLANQALANGLPPTPQNGAMVEGMEEEALRRAFG